MAGAGSWRAETVDGLTLLRCELLAAVPGVAHAFSTRAADGAGDFDLGRADSASAEWDARRGRLCRAAGLDAGAPAILAQVHGARLVRAAEIAGADPPRADGAVALRGDGARVAPGVRVADCVPLLLADRRGRAVAAVHAGWRGTARGIAARAVELLGSLGLAAGELLAALGPSIGPCCYEVSDEVVREVAAACGGQPGALARPGPAGRPLLDLREANRLQLLRAGLAPDAVASAPWCTVCTPRWFFSHRRDGAGTGRMLACIGWSGRAGRGAP